MATRFMLIKKETVMKAKKAYITPTTEAYNVSVVNMLAASGNRGISDDIAEHYTEGGIAGDNNGDVYAREVIETPDAWEEW